MRYQSLTIETPGSDSGWKTSTGEVIPEKHYVIIDTRDDNRIVSRFDDGTCWPNNPVTACWREQDRLNKAYTAIIKEVYLKSAT